MIINAKTKKKTKENNARGAGNKQQAEAHVQEQGGNK